MSLESRSGHNWIIYRPDGKYGRKVRMEIPDGTPDPQAYHDAFIQEWKALKQGTEQSRPLTGLTIGELWPEYMKWSELHHAKTTHKDLINVGKWVKKYLGQYDAEAIGPHHVSIYQRLRAAEAKREIPRAINKELAYLGGMVKWAGRQGHITPRRLQSDKLKYNRPIPIVLSVDEVLRIIEAAEPFYRTFFLCLYSLGLRIGEVRGLRWDGVDYENMTITVQQKGGSYKNLPMSEKLKAALEGIGKHVPGQLVFESKRRDGKGGPVMDIRLAIRRACKAAKVEKRVTPHLFRHSIATHLMSENTNASLIQKMLGHAQLSTTQWYSHVSAANLREVGKTIAGLLR